MHFGLAQGQGLTCPDEERHTRPSPVIDLQSQRGKGFGGRASQNSGRALVTVILPSHVVVRVGDRHRGKHVALAVGQGVQVTAGWRFHGNHGQDLHQVVLDNVTQTAHPVVEAAPALDPEVLRHSDLHAADVVTVPQRLEHGVGEPQMQDVLHRQLPQEMVDPIELCLLQDRPQPGIELLG